MVKPTNKQISEILSEIADILEMNNEMVFKIRAYRRAAREVEENPNKLSDQPDPKELVKIPGIGEGIAHKIIEISETGTCEYYEQLKKTIPVDITDLNRIEGIGPKKIKKFYDELGVRNINDLEKAAKGKRIQKLEGFRAKTEENILKGIKSLRKQKGRFRLDEAMFYSEMVLEEMKKHPKTIKVEVAGSIRRRKETVGDMDILLTSKDPKESMNHFTSLENISRVLGKGRTKATVEFDNSFQADLRIIDEKSWGAALQYFTGNKAHNIKVRKLASKKGYKLNEYGLFSKKGKLIASQTEDQIYEKLGLKTPPQEIRRDTEEVELSVSNNLPNLIKPENIKGDLQTHTKLSDGINTIKEMADYSYKLGYEYIAITEHNTEGLEVAGGISNKDIPKYISTIRNTKSKSKIIVGLEVNIDKDGSLTVPDKYLKQLDYVLIAIHSNFRMSKKDMTKRILKAFANPYVHAFAHPTGRLLLRRDPYEFDFEAVCKKAKEKNICMEINAHPERLDLNGEYSQHAKKIGCTFCIGTDSHSTLQLENMKYGIYMARRGWLEKKDVINTFSYDKLMKFLNTKS